MGRYDIFSLTEEQMAAYLDGMLSDEQSNMVEELIASDEDLQQIQDALDAVDSTFIGLDPAEDVPLECLADDFVLPEIPVVDDIAHDHDDVEYNNDDVSHDDFAHISDDLTQDDNIADTDTAGDYDAGDDNAIDGSNSSDDYSGEDFGFDGADF